MKNWVYILFLTTLTTGILSSCSDAEIVAGKFKGKLYRADTLDAYLQITKINDGYVRIEVTSAWMNEAYIDYAQLIKNAPDAYNLRLANNTGGYNFTGYYYEGFVHVNAQSNHYVFEGKKE